MPGVQRFASDRRTRLPPAPAGAASGSERSFPSRRGVGETRHSPPCSRSKVSGMFPVAHSRAPPQPPAYPPATVPARWRLSRELATGESHLELRFGRSYLADGGTRRVERSFRLDARVDPANPGEASARGQHRSAIIGDGFEVSARATTAVRASSSALDVRIDVEVRSHDRPPWRRTWSQRIARELL